MSQLKSIIFTALFVLLFCTTQLYALGSNELNLEKQETTFSLDVIVKSLDEAVRFKDLELLLRIEVAIPPVQGHNKDYRN